MSKCPAFILIWLAWMVVIAAYSFAVGFFARRTNIGPVCSSTVWFLGLVFSSLVVWSILGRVMVGQCPDEYEDDEGEKHE